ncbi:D-alanyl-D-alanine carboxypeptidase, partial [Streptomyces sp. NPDC002920]
MKIGFSSRVAVSACACSMVGVLALGPAAVASASGADPDAPGGTRARTPRPSLLYGSGIRVRPHRDTPEVPEVSALSWLVSDARTGKVLAAYNAHRRLPPASTLKTLFALTVLPV